MAGLDGQVFVARQALLVDGFASVLKKASKKIL
jgi:hypothetical protein